MMKGTQKAIRVCKSVSSPKLMEFVSGDESPRTQKAYRLQSRPANMTTFLAGPAMDKSCQFFMGVLPENVLYKIHGEV